jgi:hypothetical protein
VLHDMFAVPFGEIAAMVDRSPEATRQLASRARRRVREAAPPPDPDLTRQRAVVNAYFAAAREGDLDALVAVLDPDVVLRAHRRDGDPLELHGAAKVAQGAISARRFAPYVRPALINGAAGVVAFDGERPFAVLAFTVIGDRAVAVDVFNDPELVAKLDIRGITARTARLNASGDNNDAYPGRRYPNANPHQRADNRLGTGLAQRRDDGRRSAGVTPRRLERSSRRGDRFAPRAAT